MDNFEYKSPRSTGQQQPSYEAPDDAVTDSEKTLAWFMQWARWASTFYNSDRRAFANAISDDRDAANATPRIGIHDEVRSCFQYYFGRQDNIDFNYLTEDRTGTTTQAPWIKGKHAAKLIDFLKGPAIQLLKAVEWSAKTENPVSVRDKQELFSKAELKLALKDEIELMKKFGVEFNPVDEEFSSMDEFDNWKANFLAPGEEASILEANQIWENNNCIFLYLRAWLHAIVGGFCAVHNFIENGRLKKEHIDSWQLLWDNRKDGDFGEKQRFRGFIEFLTPGEVLGRARWKEQLDKIPGAVDEIRYSSSSQNSSGFNDFINFYNNGSNFNWWKASAGDCTIACVTLYFAAPRNLSYKKSRNRYGEYRVTKVATESGTGENRADTGDWTTGDLHRITLIGNKYAVDWGLATNVVREFGNRSNPINPISVFFPNMIGGEPRGTMTMLKSNQDEIDRLSHKIRELTGKDAGRAVVFRTPMGDSANHLKIADELKDVGVTVIPYNPDLPDELKGQKWAEVLDLSQSQYIQQYLTLRDAEQKAMEEILNISKNALGMMSGYISKGAQQNAVQYSSMGTSYLFEGFMNFVQNDMRLATNQQKLVRALQGRDENVMFSLGPAGVKFMKYTKSMRYEEVMLYLKVGDVVDESGRQRILAYAQAWSQNPVFGVSPDDILMLEQEKTYSGMIRKLRYSMKVARERAQDQQAQQDLMSMIAQEQKGSQQQQIEQMRQQGQAAMNQDNNRLRAAELMMDQSRQQAPPV